MTPMSFFDPFLFRYASFTVCVRVCNYTRHTTFGTPCRSMTRSAAQHRSHHLKSHHFALIEQCSIFCARPRDFAAARLRLQAKLGLFHCFRPKRTVENFSPNQWVLLSFIFFLFLYFFRCFSGGNGSFVLQIVQFPRTWCSNHFVSSFEIQIWHVSKFFNHFWDNSILQENEKRKKRGKKRTTHKQSNRRKMKNQCDLPFLIFACLRHFVFFRTGTLVCCKFYGKRVVGILGGLRERVAKSRRQENFVNTLACLQTLFHLSLREVARLRTRLLRIL